MDETLNIKQLYDEQNGVKENFYPYTSTKAVYTSDGGTLENKIAELEALIRQLLAASSSPPRGIHFTIVEYASFPESVEQISDVEAYTNSHPGIWKSRMEIVEGLPNIWKRYRYRYTDGTEDSTFTYEPCASLTGGENGTSFEEIYYYCGKNDRAPTYTEVNKSYDKGLNADGVAYSDFGFIPDPIGKNNSVGWYAFPKTITLSTKLYKSKRIKVNDEWSRFSEPVLSNELPEAQTTIMMAIYKGVAVGETTSAPLLGAKLEPADYSGTITNLSDGWTINPNSISGDKLIWQCNGFFNNKGELIKWDGPFKVSGPQGISGKDGIRIENMYACTKDIETVPDLTPLINQGDNVVTSNIGAWYPLLSDAVPDGNNTFIQWITQRTSDRFGNWVSNEENHGWGTPIVFNQFGRDGQPGEDGDGVEFIYILSTSETKAPTIYYDVRPTAEDSSALLPPPSKSPNYQLWDTTEFLPWSKDTEDFLLDNPLLNTVTNEETREQLTIGNTNWTQWLDDAPQINPPYKFLWWAQRRKIKQGESRVKTWTPYSTPTVLSRYAQDGSSYTLDLENDSDYVYYMNEEVTIDSDGVNTGKLLLQDKVDAIPIDELYVRGYPYTENNYETTETQHLLYASGQPASAEGTWIGFGDGWAAKIRVDKLADDNLRVSVVDAKILTPNFINEDGKSALKNNLLRIPITAVNKKSNIKCTCIFKVIAIEDLDGNQFIWRYKLIPSVSQITKIVRGTNKEAIETIYEYGSDEFTVSIERDSANTAWQPLKKDGDIDKYIVRIVGNSNKAVIFDSEVITMTGDELGDTVISIPVGGDENGGIIEQICNSNGAYIELYVNDGDYKHRLSYRNNPYYLVDQELLTVTVNYQVTGAQGDTGPQGPAGISGEPTPIMNLSPDNSFYTKEKNIVTTIVSFYSGFKEKYPEKDLLEWVLPENDKVAVVYDEETGALTATIKDPELKEADITIYYLEKKHKVTWHLHKITDYNEDGLCTLYTVTTSPGFILVDIDEEENVTYNGLPIHVTISPTEIPTLQEDPKRSYYIELVAEVPKNGGIDPVKLWTDNTDLITKYEETIGESDIERESELQNKIKDAVSLYLDIYIRGDKDLNKKPDSAKVFPDKFTPGLPHTDENRYVFWCREVIPVSKNTRTVKPVISLGQVARTRYWKDGIPNGGRCVELGDVYIKDSDGNPIKAENGSWSADEYVIVNGYVCNKYYDMVYYRPEDANLDILYLATKTHDKDKNIPPSAAGSYWKEAEQFDFLNAAVARIDELSAKRILTGGLLVYNDTDLNSPKFVAGMINGNSELPTGNTFTGKTRIFAGLPDGDTNPANAYFTVDDSGHMEAWDATIYGSVSANAFKVEDKYGNTRFLLQFFEEAPASNKPGLDVPGMYIGINNSIPYNSSSWIWSKTSCFDSVNDDIAYPPYNVLSLSGVNTDSLENFTVTLYDNDDTIGYYKTINGVKVTNGSNKPIIYEYKNNSYSELTSNSWIFIYDTNINILICSGTEGSSPTKYKVSAENVEMYKRIKISNGIVSDTGSERVIPGYSLYNNDSTLRQVGELSYSDSAKIGDGDKTIGDYMTSHPSKTFALFKRDNGKAIYAQSPEIFTSLA